jgi:hypothetical protein
MHLVVYQLQQDKQAGLYSREFREEWPKDLEPEAQGLTAATYQIQSVDGASCYIH